MSSCAIACYLREKTDPHLTAPSFQVLVGSDKGPSEPHFLQAQHPQLPQLVLTGFVFQTLHQLHCPFLDTLQYFRVLHQAKCVCLHSSPQGFLFLGEIPSVDQCASPSHG